MHGWPKGKVQRVVDEKETHGMFLMGMHFMTDLMFLGR